VLSVAHCASTFESGIALAAETVDVLDAAPACGGCAAAVARPRRTIRSAAAAVVACILGEVSSCCDEKGEKKSGNWSGANSQARNYVILGWAFYYVTHSHRHDNRDDDDYSQAATRFAFQSHPDATQRSSCCSLSRTGAVT
jgi:hypothetical protein